METYRDRVKELHPQAELMADYCNGRGIYEVKIADRYYQGSTPSKAWQCAFDAINGKDGNK